MDGEELAVKSPLELPQNLLWGARLRHCAGSLMVLLALAGCGGGGSDSSQPDDPLPVPTGYNVLFLMTEDQGGQSGFMGTPAVSTPNMDALAASGTWYRRGYVTFATCSASKASMLTGLYNHTTGANANVQEYVGSSQDLAAANPSWLNDPNSNYNLYRIRSTGSTLIETLHDHGYYTGLQNKFHMSPHQRFPYDRWYQPSGDSYNQIRSFVTDAKAANKPWFLLHVIEDTHRPYPNGDTTPLKVDTNAVEIPAQLPDTATARQDWAEYLQALQNGDRRVGDALRALQDSGVAQNTVVVLIGDHGPSYHRGKYTVYNMGLQVPVVFSGPGIASGAARPELFSGVDMMPTLLDLLGLPPLQTTQGHSQKALLTSGSTAGANQYLVGETIKDRSITDGRYQLLFMPEPAATFLPADNKDFDPWRNRVYRHILANADQPGFEVPYRLLDMADATLSRYTRPRFELYDLQTDPWQVHDLAADSAYAGELSRLKTALSQWMSTNNDSSARP